MSVPSINGDVTVTVTGSIAEALLTHSGRVLASENGWWLPNGRLTYDPRQALTAALVAIAERPAPPRKARGVGESESRERAGVADGSLIRSFLLSVLSHDAVTDEVIELLSDHLMMGQDQPSVIAENLKPLITGVLDEAASEDWEWVARALIAEACEALGIEHPLDRTPGAQTPPAKRCRRKLRSLDPGELREKLAEIYTHEPLPRTKAILARLITYRISQQTGISRSQIQADAKADAKAIRQANHDSTSQRNKQTTAADTTEANAPLRQGFVRTLTRNEALTLIEKGEKSPFAYTRKRAAIILASNAGVTAQELGAIHNIGAAGVLSVIADFNERGVACVGDFPQ
jgi:hypothetical protein